MYEHGPKCRAAATYMDEIPTFIPFRKARSNNKQQVDMTADQTRNIGFEGIYIQFCFFS